MLYWANWPHVDTNPLMAAQVRVGARMPKKLRVRAVDEQLLYQVTRVGYTLHCKTYDVAGHNTRTCKNYASANAGTQV